MEYLGGRSLFRSVAMNRLCCHADDAIIKVPINTKPIPMIEDNRLLFERRPSIIIKKYPNLATRNPSPIAAIPVRNHASRVRSAAKKTRGSES